VNDDLRRAAAEDPAIGIYPVDRCGALHSEVIEILLKSSAGLFIIGCPAICTGFGMKEIPKRARSLPPKDLGKIDILTAGSSPDGQVGRIDLLSIV